MNLAAYFERIGYTGTNSPTLENLRKLQTAHLMAVPFENLNLHIPREIILDEKLLFAKIVNEKRGGYCFEQNGLFSAILREMGYDVQRIESVMYNHETQRFSVTMCHMGLMVTIEGKRHLVDVASNFLEPLDIDNREIQTQKTGRFQIQYDGEKYSLHSQLNGAEKLLLTYIFFTVPHDLEDYEPANDYMQHSQHSSFTQKRVCTQLKANGRYTLSDRLFVYTDWNGVREERLIESEEQFHALLAEHFGIRLQTQAPQAFLQTQS
jgi:N-hydroxyarylamine O-acetyltransferase